MNISVKVACCEGVNFILAASDTCTSFGDYIMLCGMKGSVPIHTCLCFLLAHVSVEIAWWRQKPKQTMHALHCGIYRGSAERQCSGSVIIMPKTNSCVPYCHATSKRYKHLSWHVLAAEWNPGKCWVVLIRNDNLQVKFL